jgi:hypothetical protein
MEMEKLKYAKKKGKRNAPIPRKPIPRKTEESQDSLYHFAVMMLVGLVLCLIMGVLDRISQDTTPTTDTTNTIEYID